MADFPTADWFPSKNFMNGHSGLRPLFLEVHTTPSDLNPLGVALEHEDKEESMHYIIGHDGAILQCVSEVNSALGSGALLPGYARYWNGVDSHGNPDWITFNVEILADAKSGEASKAALTAAFVLMKDIYERHKLYASLASELGGIHGHLALDPIRFAECGKNFPYSAFLDYLEGVDPVFADDPKPVEIEKTSDEKESGEELDAEDVEEVEPEPEVTPKKGAGRKKAAE